MTRRGLRDDLALAVLPALVRTGRDLDSVGRVAYEIADDALAARAGKARCQGRDMSGRCISRHGHEPPCKFQ